MVRKAFLALILVAALVGPLPGRAAIEGATIYVNSTLDEWLTDGNCTLREALLAANTDSPVDACPAGSGTDLIVLPAGTFTFSLEGAEEDAGLTGDLDIFSSLTLRGAGETQTMLDADRLDRVLDILPGSHQVRLEDLSLKNGNLGFSIDYEDSSPPSLGAGILNRAELDLVFVTVLPEHQAGFAGFRVHGVGIFNSGKLHLQNSTVRGTDVGFATGGGIYNSGDLTMIDSAVTGNHVDSGHGPGIYNSGTALIQTSNLNSNGQDIYDNIDGGNIYNSGNFRCETCSILGGIGDIGSVIFNSGSMDLTDTQVAYGITRYGYGAVIYTGGSLALLRSKVFDSTMRGIWGGGSLSIVDSEISNNRSTTYANYPQKGGGGLAFAGNVFISGTLFKDNVAGARGGAILGSGQWTIQDSTFMENRTGQHDDHCWGTSCENGMGGAIYWNGGVLNVTNTTFSGNQAADGGAGIFVQQGEVRLNSVTITQNEATEMTGSGGLALVNGKVVLHNTLIADNIEGYVPDCLQFSTDPLTGEPVSSEVISLGHNLIGVLNGCSLIPAAGDLLGTPGSPIDPQLAPLADNGGRTPTHALLPGSPALDQGAAQNCPPADQRGIPRPQGPACDIGAFELEQADTGLAVGIDIRPGTSNNQINLNSQGSVPVAILTAPGFSAPAAVDPSALTFGRTGTEDSLVWKNNGRPDCHLRDVNRDKALDLVCLFRVSQMGFQPGDTLGHLRGLLLTGELISGEDSVTILYPTSQLQDDQDTLLDRQAYLGDALLWVPLVHSGP